MKINGDKPKRVNFNDQVKVINIARNEERDVIVNERGGLGQPEPDQELQDGFLEDRLIDDLGKQVLDADRVEGQEEATQLRDGEITITPFNLNEEKEVGYFDGSGNFIFNKTISDDYDPWIESIQWNDIKPAPSAKPPPETEAPQLSPHELLDRLETVLKSDESVETALKRLNRERGGARKRTLSARHATGECEASLEKINCLTECADQLMMGGITEVYSLSCEEIRLLLEKPTTDSASQTLWFYRWTLDGEQFGPFTTVQMIEWKQAGYFTAGVYCRTDDSHPDTNRHLDSIDLDRFL